MLSVSTVSSMESHSCVTEVSSDSSSCGGNSAGSYTVFDGVIQIEGILQISDLLQHNSAFANGEILHFTKKPLTNAPF